MKIDYHKVKSFWCIHINFMKTFKTVWIGSEVSKLIYSWYNCACDHLKIPTIPLNEPLKGCKDVITTQKISFPPHDFGSSSNFWDQKVSKLSLCILEKVSACLLVFRHKKHVILLTFEKWPFYHHYQQEIFKKKSACIKPSFLCRNSKQPRQNYEKCQLQWVIMENQNSVKLSYL